MVDIEGIKEEDYFIIKVKGEIDASSSIELDNVLKEASSSYHKILIDLSDLEYISSAGLGVFISYLEDLKRNNIHLVLYGLKPNVSEVFNILGLQHLMEITESKDHAVAKLNEV